MILQGFQTAVIGAYPRPAPQRNPATGEFREVPCQVEETIRAQEEIGLDILSEGTDWRGDRWLTIVAALAGCSSAVKGRSVIQQDLTWKGPIVVDRVRRALQATRKPVVVTLPGPATIVDAVQDDHYQDPRALAFAYAEAIRLEIRALQEAGCSTIVLEDPGLAIDVKRAKAWGLAALELCISGVAGLTSVVQLCRPAPTAPHRAEDLSWLLDLLGATSFSGVSLEATEGRFDMASLDLLKGKIVVLGCLDVETTEVEHVDDLLVLVGRALEVVPQERLWLAPCCGLHRLPGRVARAKLTRLIQAAEIVRERRAPGSRTRARMPSTGESPCLRSPT